MKRLVDRTPLLQPRARRIRLGLALGAGEVDEREHGAAHRAHSTRRLAAAAAAAGRRERERGPMRLVLCAACRLDRELEDRVRAARALVHAGAADVPPRLTSRHETMHVLARAHHLLAQALDDKAAAEGSVPRSRRAVGGSGTARGEVLADGEVGLPREQIRHRVIVDLQH